MATIQAQLPAPVGVKRRRGGQLSDMTLTAVPHRMKVPVAVHCFRSSFRDWAAERTGYPNEMAKMAFAHAIGNKVEAAYRRGDLFEKRRRMMDDRAAFCAAPATRGDVIPLSLAGKARHSLDDLLKGMEPGDLPAAEGWDDLPAAGKKSL